jgi:hypothetical protein
MVLSGFLFLKYIWRGNGLKDSLGDWDKTILKNGPAPGKLPYFTPLD